jgi:hypothetical protein
MITSSSAQQAAMTTQTTENSTNSSSFVAPRNYFSWSDNHCRRPLWTAAIFAILLNA